ncbi:SH3 domain-containing protein [Mariprofundus ferrooxydans]|uniref:SH3 domain-containing protein n=1 Tax=Mariprofundus ferrooxydans TaxID=314344 RepID=UPI00030DB283|nr:SH3 domain-containing protein [Mariprofundus ferrooxydans]
MGSIAGRRQPVLALLLLICLPGCVALGAAAAVPGTLVDVVTDQFRGEEVSFASNMRRTIAATQAVLQTMQLDIDVLESQQNGGYIIGFSNDRLDGTINLRKQTERLTTMNVKVRSNTREKSVERAIVDLLRQELKTLPETVQFDKSQYQSLMEKPSTASARVGWFRAGARLQVVAQQSGKQDWLKVELPSGKMAYLKGTVVNK